MTAARRVAAALLLACSPALAQHASLRGVVRDAKGGTLPGTGLALRCPSDPAHSSSVLSGEGGSYRFAGLSPCAYVLTAQHDGYTAASLNVAVDTETAGIARDITLDQPANAGSGTTPKPTFEAAGIRGLIDPGGYSAPANAAAASGLISGMADVERKETPLPNGGRPSCAEGREAVALAAKHPEDVDAARRAGRFYLAQGSPQLAIPYLERVARTASQSADASDELAGAQEAAGQFVAARNELLALPDAQQSPPYHRLLARAEEGLSHFRAAVEQYRLLAKEQPSEANSFALGYELILAGSPREAAEVLHEAIGRYPRSLTLRLGAAAAEFLLGQGSAALQLLFEASDQDPVDPRPYPFLARVFASAGEPPDRVRAIMKRHLALSPKDAGGYAAYASVLLHTTPTQAEGAAPARAQYGEAQALLKQALALDPKLVDAHADLATIYLHRDDFASAARELEIMLTLAPANKEANYRLATAYRRSGRTAQADEQLRLFREARDTEAKNGGASLLPFLSVVDHAGQRAPRAACSEPAP